MKHVRPFSLFKDLLKTNSTKPANSTKPGRLLGLDVGGKYVGLAVSDEHNKIAKPLSVLLRKKANIELMARDLQSLASDLSIEGFVVGLPFDRHRTTNDDTQVKSLMEDLFKTGKLEGIKYTYWDECFTSKIVELLLQPLDLHHVDAKSISDKFAAVGILQGYLDFVNKKLKSETPEIQVKVTSQL